MICQSNLYMHQMIARDEAVKTEVSDELMIHWWAPLVYLMVHWRKTKRLWCNN
jgi:hypothetical protein